MHAVYYKKQNVVLCDYKITTVQTPKITAYVAAVFGADMSKNADLNFRTQTLPRRLFWLQ